MTNTLTYFAYGSNMLSRRLVARVPSARPAGVGRLHGHVLRWHMHGSDGSAKCDAEHTGRETDALWGVLFTFDPAHKPHLDAAEGLGVAYAETRVHDRDRVPDRCSAYTYRALRRRDGLQPFHWYRRVRRARGAGARPAGRLPRHARRRGGGRGSGPGTHGAQRSHLHRAIRRADRPRPAPAPCASAPPARRAAPGRRTRGRRRCRPAASSPQTVATSASTKRS